MFRSALPAFLIISALLHAAPLIVWIDSGQQAAGGSGEDSVTLKAASASLGELVKEWTKPPSVAPALTQPVQPSDQHLPDPTVQSLNTPVALPQIPLAPQSPKAPALPLPMAAPADDTAPNIDTRSPERPKKQPDPAPKSQAKPPVIKKRAPPEVSKPKPQNRPKPAATSRAQAKKQAKGLGQSAAGSGGAAQETTGNTQRQANLRKQWEAQILARLARQNRHSRERGVVRLRLVINTTGKTRSVSIAKSSKTPALDAKAISLAKRARLPRAPRKLAAGDYNFVVQFVFKP
jgi:protein TonB